MDKQKLPKIVYANIIFFIYIIAASIGGIVARHLDSEWKKMIDIQLKYDLLFGVGFIMLSLISVLGLVLKKEWGRGFAISLNMILFFSSFIMRVGIYLFSKFSFGEGVIIIDPDAIIISILSFFFVIYLSTKNVKKIFKAET